MKNNLYSDSVIIAVLKERLDTYQSEIQRLREENLKLKENVWKDEEVKRLKDMNVYLQNLCNNLTMTEEEKEKVRDWAKNHKHKNYEDISYIFTPFSIGIAGEAMCNQCKETFQFRYD